MELELGAGRVVVAASIAKPKSFHFTLSSKQSVKINLPD